MSNNTISTYPSQPTPLLLEGTPYEIGFTHGKVLKSQIHSIIKAWKISLSDELGMDAGEAINRFIRRTDYLSAMRRWTPYLVDEIRGIADGAGLDFDTILAFQLLDEMWNNAGVIYKDHCSAIGFDPRPDQPTCIAQNLDVETFRDKYQVILRIRQGGLDTFIVTCPGTIGFNGMNNQGVGVCANTLMALNHRSDGLPVACVIRGVLAQRTAQDAAAFLQSIDHASGQNYLVGGKDQVSDYECSAYQVARFQPMGNPGVLWHTNHPLANTDLTTRQRVDLQKGKLNPGYRNSTRRYKAVQRRISNPEGLAIRDLVKEILSSKDSPDCPICGSRDATGFYAQIKLFTFASTIMVLGEQPELHVSFGPPDVERYWKFEFNAEG